MILDNETLQEIAVYVILALLGYKQASPWVRGRLKKSVEAAPVEQEGPDDFELMNQRLIKIETQLDLLLERGKHGNTEEGRAGRDHDKNSD